MLFEVTPLVLCTAAPLLVLLVLGLGLELTEGQRVEVPRAYEDDPAAASEAGVSPTPATHAI